MLLGRRASAGRDEEFVAFVRDAQPRLLRVAWAMCGDRYRAEDHVQAVLLRLYRVWDRVDRDLGPWAYARRAVVNAVIDDSRRLWRRETPTENLPDRPGHVVPGMSEDLVAALAGLPAMQRAVVVLRHVEDLDVETVAGMLGISPGTVKSHTSRGITALRTELARGRLAGTPSKAGRTP